MWVDKDWPYFEIHFSPILDTIHSQKAFRNDSRTLSCGQTILEKSHQQSLIKEYHLVDWVEWELQWQGEKKI